MTVSKNVPPMTFLQKSILFVLGDIYRERTFKHCEVLEKELWRLRVYEGCLLIGTPS